MTTRKIADIESDKICLHREHNPPMHQFYPDGYYEHECPGCGHKQYFSIRRPVYASGKSYVSAERPVPARWKSTL